MEEGVFDTTKQIGVMFTGVSVLFFVAGMVLLFDPVLIIMANILFICGVCFIVGFKRVGGFFFQRNKLRGTICFAVGFFVILIFKRTILGILIEAFGFLNLFGDFFPMLLAAARRVPILGDILSMPGVKQFLDRLIVGESLPL